MGQAIKRVDSVTDRICDETARSFARLAELRGVDCHCVWDGSVYRIDGAPIGASIHACYDWLDMTAAR